MSLFKQTKGDWGDGLTMVVWECDNGENGMDDREQVEGAEKSGEEDTAAIRCMA